MSVLVPPPSPPILRRWAASCLDLLFPHACAVCGRYGHRICPACAQTVVPVPDTICERCGRVQETRIACCSACLGAESSPLLQVRAAGLHVEPLRHLIHLLKYEERPDLAPDLARYLAAALAGPDWGPLWPEIDAIAPVVKSVFEDLYKELLAALISEEEWLTSDTHVEGTIRANLDMDDLAAKSLDYTGNVVWESIPEEAPCLN